MSGTALKWRRTFIALSEFNTSNCGNKTLSKYIGEQGTFIGIEEQH